jgi:hypothetical protein
MAVSSSSVKNSKKPYEKSSLLGRNAVLLGKWFKTT